jgi:hypothetical protein
MDLSLPGAAASAASAIGAAVGVAVQAAGPVVTESMGQMGQVVGPAVAALDTTQLLAVAAALGWASGLRLYLVVFLTGLAGWLGWVPLPAGLQLLQNPLVLGTAGFMLFIEFFADKIPGLDSLWDLVHSVVRIPAGAALAAAVFGADAGAWTMVAALMGGTLAATSQAAKTTTRAAINTSPEPLSNIGASLLGDVAVPGMLWLSWTHPVGFFIALAIVLVVMVVLIVMFWRFLRAVLRKLREVFSPAPAQG